VHIVTDTGEFTTVIRRHSDLKVVVAFFDDLRVHGVFLPGLGIL
jgi:hypothetical protein